MSKGYVNGSDLLLMVGDKCVGHCTSHSVTYNSETKEHAVKPASTAKKSAGKWKGKTVTGLSISISFEGLCFYEETENGHAEIAPMWGKGDSIDVKTFEREGDATPAIVGKFVIASLEKQAPANDDVTYSGTLENDGEPTTYPGKTTTSDVAHEGK